MKIRETRTIARSTRLERQQQTLESIAELEQQYAEGEIEQHAYLIKKRVLIRML